MRTWLLRKYAKCCKNYAVIESDGLFGDFFGYVGVPNDSFTVVLALNKKHAVRRYCKRYYLKHNRYPDYYNPYAFIHSIPMKFSRYCVIEKGTKKQTFYNQ